MRRRKHRDGLKGLRPLLESGLGLHEGPSPAHTSSPERAQVCWLSWRSGSAPGSLWGPGPFWTHTPTAAPPLQARTVHPGLLMLAVHVEIPPSTKLVLHFLACTSAPTPSTPPHLHCQPPQKGPPTEGAPQRPTDRPQCTGLRAQFPGRPNSLDFKIQSQGQSTGSSDKTA